MVQAPFDRFCRYDELTRLLHDYAREYPALVRVATIGHSFEGRDIWLATITDFASGGDADKPAMWIDGNIHASEVSASTACLYVLDTLVRGFGVDAAITRCLLTRAFYICPRVNPDGAEWALADVPRLIRSSTRAYPFDEEPLGGLVREDIDGDGRMLTMRIRDSAGRWKVWDAEPRLLVRREPDEVGGDYYRLLPEGRVEDYDGATIHLQALKHGLDINRNFPTGWKQEHQQPGAGPYPASEPEIRAVVDFLAFHPNIIAGTAFHTYSGVLLRPYGDRNDEAFPQDDLNIYKVLGEKGTAITGYPALSIFHEFRYGTKDTVSGGLDAYMYEHMGAFFFAVELWSPQRQAGITEYKHIDWNREHPPEHDRLLLAWSDAALQGKGYIDWYPYDHPQLGAIELGGWNYLHAFRNPPPHLLEKEVARFPAWIIWQLLLSPLLEVHSSQVGALGDRRFQLRVVLQNVGWLPTYVTKKALEKDLVRGIVCELELPADARIELGAARTDLGQLEGRSYSQLTFNGPVEVTDNRVKAEWVVYAPSGGSAKLAARHQRAGVVHVEFALA